MWEKNPQTKSNVNMKGKHLQDDFLSFEGILQMYRKTEAFS